MTSGERALCVAAADSHGAVAEQPPSDLISNDRTLLVSCGAAQGVRCHPTFGDRAARATCLWLNIGSRRTFAWRGSAQLHVQVFLHDR